LVILNRVHNHEMVPKLEGHILAGRLKEEDKHIVHDLTKSLVPPKNILMSLKGKRHECLTNIKQVYNARQRIKKSSRDDKTKMQHLVAKLEEYK